MTFFWLISAMLVGAGLGSDSTPLVLAGLVQGVVCSHLAVIGRQVAGLRAEVRAASTRADFQFKELARKVENSGPWY